MNIKNKIFKSSFTTRYNVSKLWYYEVFISIEEAIACEKQIKAGSGKKKIILIEEFNHEWNDLSSNFE